MNIKILLLLLAPIFVFGATASGAERDYDIVARTINFVIFAGILYYLIAEPVKKAYKGRINSIAARLDAIQDELRASKAQKDEVLKKVEDAKNSASGLLESTDKEIEILISKIEKDTQNERLLLQKSYEEQKDFGDGTWDGRSRRGSVWYNNLACLQVTVITNTLRLLSLDESTKRLIEDGKLTQGHAKVIVRLDKDDEKMVVDTIVGQRLNVRDTENLIKRIKNKAYKSSNLVSMQQNYNENLNILKDAFLNLGYECKINGKKMILNFADVEKIQNLIQVIQKIQ